MPTPPHSHTHTHLPATRPPFRVGKQVTDADLNMIFDDANQNGDGGLSLREFANYARGAAASSNARGLAELKKEGATALVAATFRHSGEHPSAK